MKILYVHELFPPESVGGGETHAINMVRLLKRRGHKVYVVAGTKHKTRKETYKGIKVYRVNFRPSRYLFNITALRGIEKIVKEFKPDVIHTNAFHSAIPAYLVGKKHNIPVIVNVHFFFQQYYKEYFDPIRSVVFSKFERFVISYPYDAIIALDYYVYQNLKAIGKKSILIEHAIDTKRFKPKRKKHNYLVVGTQLTAGKTKRNDLFIELAKKLKKTYVRFYAVGTADKKMRKAFKKYGIVYHGRVPYDEMPEHYNHMDIYFGHGMGAKEAMACGCVAILNEKTKRLVQYHNNEIKQKVMLVGNPVNLINKLQKRAYRKRMSIKSVKFVRKNYSSDKIIKRVEEVYKKVLK